MKQSVNKSGSRALLLQGKFQDVLDEIPLEKLPSSVEEEVAQVAHGEALAGLNQSEFAKRIARIFGERVR